MQQVHNSLLKKQDWYASWHKNAHHQKAHWAAFVLAGAFLTLLVIVQTTGINQKLQGVPSSAAVTCDYYASPTGNGSGTLASPFSLHTALGQPNLLSGNKTLCLKGGTYRGKYESHLNGGTVRSAPGEWAKIDSINLPLSHRILVLQIKLSQ